GNGSAAVCAYVSLSSGNRGRRGVLPIDVVGCRSVLVGSRSLVVGQLSCVGVDPVGNAQRLAGAAQCVVVDVRRVVIGRLHVVDRFDQCRVGAVLAAFGFVDPPEAVGALDDARVVEDRKSGV